jgi:hypothetical protein
MNCSPTDGQLNTPKLCSRIGSKNPATKRPLGARAAVTLAPTTASPAEKATAQHASVGRLLENQLFDIAVIGGAPPRAYFA